MTDDKGATGTSQQSVTVTAPTSGRISLTATGYKVKGMPTVDLAWTDPGSGSVDVYRNGKVIITTPDDGAYTDKIGQKGGGTFTYKVCEAATTTCSNEATVTF